MIFNPNYSTKRLAEATKYVRLNIVSWGAKFPDARSLWRLNFVWWLLISLDRQYGISFPTLTPRVLR